MGRNTLIYRFVYIDGKVVDKLLTKTQALWFAHNEGDHLTKWFPLKRVDNTTFN